MDRLPQERLVIELRGAIDAVRDRPYFFSSPRETTRRTLVRLRKLIEENPRSVNSSHVRYNIGVSRSRWLDEALRVLPLRGDAAIPQEERSYGQDEGRPQAAPAPQRGKGQAATATLRAARRAEVRARRRQP